MGASKKDFMDEREREILDTPLPELARQASLLLEQEYIEPPIPQRAQEIIDFFQREYDCETKKDAVDSHNCKVCIGSPYDFTIQYSEYSKVMTVELEGVRFVFHGFKDLEIWLRYLN